MADYPGWTVAVEAPSVGADQAVTINRVENGYIARVGCKTFVFKTVEELNEALTLYYTDYKAAYEKYVRKAA